MQLIFETKPSIELANKMTSLDSVTPITESKPDNELDANKTINHDTESNRIAKVQKVQAEDKEEKMIGDCEIAKPELNGIGEEKSDKENVTDAPIVENGTSDVPANDTDTESNGIMENQEVQAVDKDMEEKINGVCEISEPEVNGIGEEKSYKENVTDAPIVENGTSDVSANGLEVFSDDDVTEREKTSNAPSYDIAEDAQPILPTLTEAFEPMSVDDHTMENDITEPMSIDSSESNNAIVKALPHPEESMTIDTHEAKANKFVNVSFDLVVSENKNSQKVVSDILPNTSDAKIMATCEAGDENPIIQIPLAANGPGDIEKGLEKQDQPSSLDPNEPMVIDTSDVNEFPKKFLDSNELDSHKLYKEKSPEPDVTKSLVDPNLTCQINKIFDESGKDKKLQKNEISNDTENKSSKKPDTNESSKEETNICEKERLEENKSINTMELSNDVIENNRETSDVEKKENAGDIEVNQEGEINIDNLKEKKPVKNDNDKAQDIQAKTNENDIKLVVDAPNTEAAISAPKSQSNLEDSDKGVTSSCEPLKRDDFINKSINNDEMESTITDSVTLVSETKQDNLSFVPGDTDKDITETAVIEREKIEDLDKVNFDDQNKSFDNEQDPLATEEKNNDSEKKQNKEEIISLDSTKTANADSDRKSSPLTVIDCEEIQELTDKSTADTRKPKNKVLRVKTTDNTVEEPKKAKSVCSLSNTLDILSDDDDVITDTDSQIKNFEKPETNISKCINLDDDDDVMLIDDSPEDKPSEASPNNDSEISKTNNLKKPQAEGTTEIEQINTINLDNDSEPETNRPASRNTSSNPETQLPPTEEIPIEAPKVSDKPEESVVATKSVINKPIIPENFLKAFRKNVIDMNRDELEEFCLMRIVEGIIDQTNLSEIKTKLKTMACHIEDWKKKVTTLTKQNRDLQIVLKTVQEEQKKRVDNQVVPLKITRSVGMQVYMTEVVDKNGPKRKFSGTPPVRNVRNTTTRPTGKPNMNPIPVPRLVPAANNSPLKTRPPTQVQNATVTSNSPKQMPQNATKASPQQKTEKRPFSSVNSVTVDLTDDEPPAKQPAPMRVTTQQPPVRLVAQQSLMKPRAPPPGNNPSRKVFIPINPQSNIRPGQTITLKSVAPNGRLRGPAPGGPIRMAQNAVRLPRPGAIRHPAPLPEVAKQQQPPNWKALPPAPDLKISKVENGIVISWKIEGYQEDSYEEIASYQLYAYQETSSPPSTLLWKKIGDVKALPLPMACTLTQFMAGYKYYFAVRAVDIRSRIGAFSLPGSILLLNK